MKVSIIRLDGSNITTKFKLQREIETPDSELLSRFNLKVITNLESIGNLALLLMVGRLLIIGFRGPIIINNYQ